MSDLGGFLMWVRENSDGSRAAQAALEMIEGLSADYLASQMATQDKAERSETVAAGEMYVIHGGRDTLDVQRDEAMRRHPSFSGRKASLESVPDRE